MPAHADSTSRALLQVRARHTVGGVLLEARHGDLCKEEVGAIVNAANEQLRHGGGVARAIADQAGCGGVVHTESAAWVQKHGPVATGRAAAITSAGDLPAKFVVKFASRCCACLSVWLCMLLGVAA